MDQSFLVLKDSKQKILDFEIESQNVDNLSNFSDFKPPCYHKTCNHNVIIEFPAQCFKTSIQLNSGVFFTPKMVYLQYPCCKNITNLTYENN